MSVVGEHRAAAALTRYDVDALDVVAGLVAALHAAAVDRDVDATAVALAVLLSRLPAGHALVTAARCGVEVADLCHERRAALVQASHVIAAEAGPGDGHVPLDELRRRRYPPDGDRAAWVRSGGAA